MNMTRTTLQRGIACAFCLVAWLTMAAQLAQAQQMTVAANDEISAAGYKKLNTTDHSGHLPPQIALPDDATSMTFAIFGGTELHLKGYKGRCTSPCLTVNDGTGDLYNDADGVGSAGSLNVLADESNSGIQAPVAGFLAGVFEAGPPTGAPPATLDFTTIGTNFPSLSPVLQQLFFIGDGLTGDGSGSVQIFYVPTGAESLYFGIPDACYYNGSPSCYRDNKGALIVSYAITTQSGLPKVTLVSPASGKPGSWVRIWGHNLLNATAVSFNGLPAQFTVESTLITAIVPDDATSGPIEVTTPNGLAGESKFTIEP